MTYTLDDPAEFKRRIVERLKVQGRVPISGIALETAQFNVMALAGEQLFLSLAAEMLSDKVEDREQTAVLEVPASAWQHFKHDHASAWFMRALVKRRPVRMDTWEAKVRFETYFRYPEATVALPPNMFGKAIVYENSTHGNWRMR